MSLENHSTARTPRATRKRIKQGRATHDRAFTDADLTRSTDVRLKVFDRKCHGLYADMSPNGRVKFAFRYRDKATSKQHTVPVGAFDPVHFPVTKAREIGHDLAAKAANGTRLTKHLRMEAHDKLASALTFDDLADMYVTFLQVPEKRPDGEMRPRKESFKYDIDWLKRPRATFGHLPACEITDDDIMAMLNGVIDEGHAATANNMRTTLHSLFKWAAEAGRKLVKYNPCSTLPKRPKTPSKNRALSPDEIHTLWNGLDRDDMPVPRYVCLGLKLILATMLRPTEVITARRDELKRLNRAKPEYHIPLKRVKKRRVIHQPLNSLALEIVAELMALPENENGTLFPQGAKGAPITVMTLGKALSGRTDYKRGKPIKHTPGIVEVLGMKKFTPHDLRRTAATLLGSIKVSNTDIGRCLDHKKSEGPETTQVYNVAVETEFRRDTLNVLDRLLRAVIDGHYDEDGVIGVTADNILPMKRKAA